MEHLDSYLRIRKNTLSPRFYSSTEAILRQLECKMQAQHPGAVTTETLQTWIDEKLISVKPSSAASYAKWVGLFFDWCLSRKLIEKNPVTELSLPRSRKPFRRNFLLPGQVDRLISECTDDELRYCLYCGFHAGLRLNEVVMSKPEWFDMDSGLLHVTQGPDFETKDRDDRTIPLTESFWNFLKIYGLRFPYMIAQHKSKGKLYRVYFRKRFINYVNKKGMILTFHDCRRTFASLLVSRGVSIYKVSKWLGDGVQVVERHYGHLLPNDRDVDKGFVVKTTSVRLDVPIAAEL
jgi:integrase